MTKKIFTLITLIIAFSYTNALADKGKYKREGALLNISASDSREVEEDLLVVNLRFETEGKSPQEVQEKINEKMTKALNEIKQHRKITVSTEQYSVYKYHPRTKNGEPKKTIWRGSQSLQMKSKDSAVILKTTGVLQSMELAVNELNYVVSPELREEIEDSLMEKAVEKLLSKSKRVAKSLGKDNIEVVNININSNNFYPSPMRASSVMMMKDMGDESSPVASPGQSRITTSVSATILIKD
jgi:predicted secreted protein